MPSIGRRKLLAALPSAALGLGGGWRLAGAATPGVDAPPLAQPARTVLIPPLHEHRLANGLSLLVVPRRGLPLVHASLLLRTGALADPQRQCGLAAMTATLLTKGAQRAGKAVDAVQIARLAESLGGSLDSGSGWRQTSLGMTVTTPRLPQALALMADCAQFPSLSNAEFERARAQALDGLRVALESPGELASQLARRQFWGDSAYGQITTLASLQRLGADALRTLHQQTFRPEQAALVLAGDISPEAAQRLAEMLLGFWGRPRDLPTAGVGHASATPPSALASAVALPPQPAASRTLLLDMPSAGQSAVLLAMPFAAARAHSSSAQRRVAQLANAVLGGGYSSRLNQEIRIKRGLSYGVFSDAESHPEGGMLTAQAQCDHAKAAAVLQQMRTEVARLGESEVPAQELAARQAALVGAFGRRVETAAGLAALVAGQWVAQRPLDELGRHVAEVQAISAAQIRDFAQAHWAADGLRGVVVGHLAQAGSTLDDAPGPQRRLAVTRLDLDQPDLEKSN